MSAQSINLFFTEGSSDKVFNLQLKQQGAGWVVNSQNGRRGSTLIDRQVTNGEVSYEVAKEAYDKKLKSKLKDGYTTDESGAAYSSTELAGQPLGQLPQLLNAIDEDELENKLNDDDFFAQQKFDGERLLTKVDSQVVIGSNKKGFVVGMSQAIHDGIKALGQSLEFDGEAVGDTYYVFDVLSINGQDMKNIPLALRLVTLESFKDSDSIKFVKTARTKAEKLALLMRVTATLGEGIVFKKANSLYSPSRPASGGDALKYKLVESCSVVIMGQHSSKRSVNYGVYDGEKLVDIGNVSIPVNKNIPSPGDVCEVQYLYAYPNGGSLFQPVYLGKRSDVDASECVISQLKYKQEMVAA